MRKLDDGNYTAKNIRILSDEDIANLEWVKSSTLAHQYKLPVHFVERGFECCRRLGIKVDYFIDKYIHKKPVERLPEFETVYKELLQENRQAENQFEPKRRKLKSQKKTEESF